MAVAIELSVELRHALTAAPPRLDRVGLAIAQLDDVPVDERAALDTLDAWGETVAAAARGGTAADAVDALAVFLGAEVGLTGDADEYDAPANSFLPQVLARRRGLPILLSVVYLEVARRAGIDLFGLALPGHFVVGHAPEPGRVTALDPFAGGRRLALADLEAITARAGARLQPAMLMPASPHVIATRMLRNLVASYQRRARVDKVRAAAALWLAIDPDDQGARQAHAAALAVRGLDDDAALN